MIAHPRLGRVRWSRYLVSLACLVAVLAVALAIIALVLRVVEWWGAT